MTLVPPAIGCSEAAKSMLPSFPGYQNAARDGAGQAMKNWWPFLEH